LLNIESLINAITRFNQFETCSGLKLNINKTELVPIGKIDNLNITLPKCISQIKVSQLPFKALGIWYSKNDQEILDLNMSERIKTMEKLTNIWKSRKLSLKGRITIIKSLILPQVQFLFSMIHIPNYTIEILDKILFSFLWDGKPPKIKRSTIIRSIEEGGLGMLEVRKVHTAAKCSWIKRLLNDTKSKWKVTMWHMLNIKSSILNKNSPGDALKLCKSNFHSQILDSWFTAAGIYPESATDILNQYILQNKFVKINNRTIHTDYLGDSAYNVKFIDIIDINGKLLSRELFKSVRNINISILKYNSLISAIPKKWRETAQKTTESKINRLDDEPKLKVRNCLKPITRVSNKEIYNSLFQNNDSVPTAISTWINMFPFMEQFEWSQVFRLSFTISKEPYLQSFQYKILNRILNCKEKLYIWGKSDNNKCNYCNEIDTIEHHLYTCSESKKIWQSVQSWCSTNLEIKYNLTVCEVLFGIPINNSVDMDIINFLILIAKHYINKTKVNNDHLYFIELIECIRNKVKSMVYRNTSNEMPLPEWQERLHNIL